MQIGWNMAIETTNGMVCLWTSWLGNSFKLFYPLNVNVPDEVIKESLDVTLAKPVANKMFGKRLWAKYYSEKLDDCGRVWINQTSDYSYCHQIKTIQDKKIKDVYCGYSITNTISTNEFTFCSEAEPEAPNASEEHIQKYKDKFVNLLVKIAKLVGDITAVHLDSGLVLYTPETLIKRGYDFFDWRENNTEYYYVREENFELMLKSGNSVVPWCTVIRYPSTNELKSEDLIKLLDSLDNSDNPFDSKPIIAHMIEQEKIYKDYC